MYLAPKINKSLDNIADQMVGSVNSAIHHKLVQDAFRQFGAKVDVIEDTHVSRGMIVVTGMHSPWKIRQNIELFLTYSPGGKRIKMTSELWKTLKFNLSQVLQHELIHREQCSYMKVPKEDWEEHSCKVYASKGKTDAEIEAQEYYGSTEEIEAHAHCIMMELKNFSPRTDPLKLLKKAKSLPRIKSPTLKDYLYVFDFDMAHPAIKRLFKKTVYWIEQEA